ncbi:hypothetical protein D7294_03740 [Streptomyces hoynatensis]|uniref:Uncharacterized protein n=1 Tax=Streptomyces hoynatensis TaxID=1141874 RepID=A0A3A9ZBB7_9ACTN|nr:hypothetical protein D7294_03740 [Streptomyces hoynatensis]
MKHPEERDAVREAPKPFGQLSVVVYFFPEPLPESAGFGAAGGRPGKAPVRPPDATRRERRPVEAPRRQTPPMG